MRKYKILLFAVLISTSVFVSSCRKSIGNENPHNSSEHLSGRIPTTCDYPIVNVSTFFGNGSYVSSDGSLNIATGQPWQVSVYNDIVYFGEGSKLKKIHGGVSSTFYTFSFEDGTIRCLSTDQYGNIFVGLSKNTVRKISPGGTQLASYGTRGVFGHSTIAPFNFGNINALATDNLDRLYILDDGVILRLNTDNTITTMAGNRVGPYGWVDGPVALARFEIIAGIAVTPLGDKIYFIDKAKIRVLMGGVVSTIAGSSAYGYVNGDGLSARFEYMLNAMAIDPLENLYILEQGGYGGYMVERVRKIIKMRTGFIPWKVSTLAGNTTQGFLDGVGSVAKFMIPYSLAITPDMNTMYVTDPSNYRIRKLSLTCFPAL